MRFVHIHNCKLLFDVGTLDDRIQMVAVSPAGRHIVTTTESGILQVYSVPALMTDYNRVSVFAFWEGCRRSQLRLKPGNDLRED